MDSSERVIMIISYLAGDQGEKRLTDICNHLKISKATGHRILSTLQRKKWVVKDKESHTFKIGPELTTICLGVIRNLDIRQKSLPYLISLQQDTHETAVLSLRVGFKRVYAEQVEGKQEVRMIVELGVKHPIWLGAQGRSMLAFMKQDEIEEVLDSLKKSPSKILATGQTLEVDLLRKELLKVKARGFDTSFGERVVGGASISSPIFNKENEVVGAFSVIGPQHRFTSDFVKRNVPIIKKAARSCSIELGYVENKQ